MSYAVASPIIINAGDFGSKTLFPQPECFYDHQGVLAIMFPSSDAWSQIDSEDKRIHPMLRSEGGRIFLTILTIITILPFIILRLMKYPVSINGTTDFRSSDDIMDIFKNHFKQPNPSPLAALPNTGSRNRTNGSNTRPRPPAPKPPKIYKGAPAGLTNFSGPLRNVCFANSVIQVVANTNLDVILQQGLENAKKELKESIEKKPNCTDKKELSIRELEQSRHELISSFLDICKALRADKPNSKQIRALTIVFYNDHFLKYIVNTDPEAKRMVDPGGIQYESMELFNILSEVAGDSIGMIHQSYFIDAQNKRLTNLRNESEILCPLNTNERYNSVSQLLMSNLTQVEDDYFSPTPNVDSIIKPTECILNRMIFQHHVNQLDNDRIKTRLQKHFELKDDGTYKIKNPDFEAASAFKTKTFLYNQLLRNLGTKKTPATDDTPATKAVRAEMSDLRKAYIDHLKGQDAYIKRVTSTTVEQNSNEIIISTNATSSSVNTLEQEIEVNGDRFILDATICHIGSQLGGHYVSYVRKNNQWWLCNDNHVYPVREPSHQFKTLFYRRAQEGEATQTVSAKGLDLNAKPKPKATTRAKARAAARAKAKAKAAAEAKTTETKTSQT